VWDLFFINQTASSPYRWQLFDVNNDFYSNETLNTHSFKECENTTGESVCKYINQFQAIKQGKAVIVLQKINEKDNSIVEEKYFYITINPLPTKIAYLNKPFDLKEKESAEVIDYKNMIVNLDGLRPTSTICQVSSDTTTVIQSGGCAYGGWAAVLSLKIPDETALTITLNRGETKEISPGITIRFISATNSTATFIVSQKSDEINFNIKTNKYSYRRGEDVKIIAVLSGENSEDFDNANIITTVTNPEGVSKEIKMEKVGISSSTCIESVTTGTHTCSKINEYQFVGTYNIPSDGSKGFYKVLSTAVIGETKKNDEINFQVEMTYSDYVDISIKPYEQHAIIGKEISYDVTITDKHPIKNCPPTKVESSTITSSVTSTVSQATGRMLTSETTQEASNCGGDEIYNYLISVDGLPYHTVFPTVVSVHGGKSKTFELKVFPSSVKTAEGITTASTASTATTTTQAVAERSVTITGKPIATESQSTTTSETTPAVKEAMFKFTVTASLKEESTISDSANGILYVNFVEKTKPPDFPNPEKINIDLKKGWNLISVPGNGIGFTQGTCTEKPLAFVFVSEKQTYVSLDDALKDMGKEKLLDHLSTHSLWIYSYGDCNIGFNFKSYSTYSNLALDDGWNLLGTTKDMVGETLSNIKGSCSFEKIYVWSSDSQKWIEKSENDLIEEMGYGFLIKTSASCNLKNNVIQPPPFPGE